MLNNIIKSLFILIVISIIASCSSYKYEKRDYWIKHRYRALNYIDTSKLNITATSYIIDGAIAKQKGNYSLAIVNYMLALKYDSSASILYAIADCFFLLGKYNLSIEYCHLSLHKDANFLPCYEILCKSYLYTNDVLNATITLENAIKISESEEMLYYLGYLYEYQNKVSSKDIYHKLINKYNNISAVEQLVRLERGDSNYSVAGDLLYSAFQYNPTNFRITLELINNWFIENKIDSIANNIEKFDNSFSVDDLETMYNYIIIRLDSNQSCYEKIINKIDNRFNYSQILNYSAGNYALKNNDMINARRYFNIAIEIDPTNMDLIQKINEIDGILNNKD